MTEETQGAEASADVSDAQVEKFFASGGEALLDEPAEETPDAGEPKASTNEKKETDGQESEKPDNQKPDKEKVVPYGALHEERAKRKEIQVQLQANQQQLQEQQERTQRLENAFQRAMQKMQPEKPEPTFEDDPIEAARIKIEKLEEDNNVAKQERAEREQYARIQNEVKTTVEDYRSKAAEFEKENPDFQEVYAELVGMRMKEYIALGYDEQTASNICRQEEYEIITRANQQGVNPASRLYELAKVRGIQAKPATAATDKAATQNANAKKMDQLEKGLQAGKSLSNTSGGSASNANDEFSLEAIAAMNDDELDTFIASKKNWASIGKNMR